MAKCNTIAGCDSVSAVNLETVWLVGVCMCILALVVDGVKDLHRSPTGCKYLKAPHPHSASLVRTFSGLRSGAVLPTIVVMHFRLASFYSVVVACLFLERVTESQNATLGRVTA